MEVILLERIERLGQMGDVVKVKPGYARNFLLPQKKALRATESNKEYFEGQKAELEAQNLKRRQEAEAVAAKMDGISLIMVRQAGEGGQLYGSVSAKDVADTLGEEGVKVGRNQVDLNQVIKELGVYTVPVSLHPEVTVDVAITVARSKDEADIEAARATELLENEEDALEAEALEQEAEAALEEATEDPSAEAAPSDEPADEASEEEDPAS